MYDILRTWSTFPKAFESIKSLNFIENSNYLKSKQLSLMNDHFNISPKHFDRIQHVERG